MQTRDRMVLMALGLLGLMAALWFVALAPKRQEASDLSLRVQQAQARRDTANKAAATAEVAKKTYLRDYSTVARLGKAVPPRADVPSLVYQLETAAKSAKVDFRSVTVQDVAPTPPDAEPDASAAGLVPQPFSFTFEGGFFSLRKLLRSVDRFSQMRGQKVAVSGRLLTLDGVTLRAGRKGLPKVQAEVSARGYVAPMPAALPDGSEDGAAAPIKPNPQVTP